MGSVRMRRGFTLLEIAVAVGIVMIVTSIAVVNWSGIKDGAANQNVRVAIAGTQTDIAKVISATPVPADTAALVAAMNAPASQLAPFYVDSATAAIADSDGQGQIQSSIQLVSPTSVMAVAVSPTNQCVVMVYADDGTTWGVKHVAAGGCKASVFTPALVVGGMDSPTSL